MKILLTAIYGLITGFVLLIILALALSPFDMCICDVPGVTQVGLKNLLTITVVDE